MTFWQSPFGQFVRVGLEAGVPAAFSAWGGSLGILHLPLWAVPLVGAALHAVDEAIVAYLKSQDR